MPSKARFTLDELRMILRFAELRFVQRTDASTRRRDSIARKVLAEIKARGANVEK